jgi:hypothetical protein
VLAAALLHTAEANLRHVYNRGLGFTIPCLPALSNLANSEHFYVAMRLFHAATAAQLMAARLVNAITLNSPFIPTIDIDSMVEPLEALAQLQQHTYNTLEQNDGAPKRASIGCSLATATVRRDW